MATSNISGISGVTVFKAAGFNDRNNNGIIEKKSWRNLWREEGYTGNADINQDRKIVEVEAKYYLRNLQSVSPKVKQNFPLTESDKNNLLELFNEAVDIASSIEDDYSSLFEQTRYEYHSLGEIAIMMAKTGFFKEALDVASNCCTYEENVESHIDIAVEMSHAGVGKNKIERVFSKLIRDIEGFDDLKERESYGEMIETGMAKAGFDDEEIQSQTKYLYWRSNNH